MIKFVADSGCDIFELGDVDFSTVALKINTDTRDYIDDETIDTHEMIEYLLHHKGRSYTACPTVSQWTEAFIAKDGSIPDEIYVVTMTSALSGTHNCACIARDLFQENHPEVKILVVDSLSVGPEEVMILEKLVEMKAEGMSFEEISESIVDFVMKTRLFFSFQSIHNLVQNGRVSKLAGAAVGALNLRVMGTASETGTIQSTGKARGDKRAIAAFLESIEKCGCTGGKFRISHTENEAMAKTIADALIAKYPGSDVKYYPVRGLCTYYCERGGICISCLGTSATA